MTTPITRWSHSRLYQRRSPQRAAPKGQREAIATFAAAQSCDRFLAPRTTLEISRNFVSIIAMQPLRFLMPLLLLTTAAACSAPSTSNQETAAPRVEPSPQTAGQPAASTGSKQQPTAAVPTKNVVRTETLTSQPIKITLANLPKPFATNSASKSPQVISVPPNPTLNVPAGFQVNVYADDLDAPRWLTLTPSGDVLVTETRANRIRLLRDTDGDGVADVRKTFATADNGVNIPFGMTFAGNSFFLGNTGAVLRFPYTQG